MKFCHDAHGDFPKLLDLVPESGIRIAFVDANPGCVIEPMMDNTGRLLVITANDLRPGQINRFTQWACGLSLWLSDRFKVHLLRKSIRQGDMPCCPMSLTDAVEILNFINKHEAGNSDCLVTCAYGKSRSVTTVHFLRHFLDRSYELPESIPNRHILLLLSKASGKVLKN